MFAEIKLRARAAKYRWKLDPCEIAELLRRVRRGATALDLGAHKGAYSYCALKRIGEFDPDVHQVDGSGDYANNFLLTSSSRAH